MAFATKEAARAYQAKWWKINRERRLVQKREWYAANREKIRSQSAEYRAGNRETTRAAVTRWRLTHPGEDRILSAKYRADHPEKMAIAMRRHRNAHPEKWTEWEATARARKLSASGGGVTGTQWQQILVDSLGLCAYCNGRGGLTQDHIEPLARGGEHDIENIAAVCRWCNGSKGSASLLRWLARKAAA